MTITTSASNHTIWFENGEQVWPCRCGETHRGDYAAYDWIHHNCEHGPMWVMYDEALVRCSGCGAGWETVNTQVT